MVVTVVINIFLNMEKEEDDTLTDSSFSDGEGPTADLVQPGRLYTYSSSEDEKSRKHVPVQQKIRAPRFVSRIQHERVQMHSEKLDLEKFQPMMTSEKLREGKKRESESEDWYEEPSKYLRKRERKESDYGSLSSLGSDMIKLDIMEQESNYREPDRSSKLLSECLTFRQTMTQLRKQTTTLVKEMEETKKRVDDSHADTEKLKTEYQKMNQETQDMISHLKFARSRIKSVIKKKK
eukprot:GFUD01011367.1.p1 GENE.GFUD01011367.1~~GFUD01011367.1.p1  ORF type:complete len:236 (+),score=58.80 GFUD01011367.1:103-810(+)